MAFSHLDIQHSCSVVIFFLNFHPAPDSLSTTGLPIRHRIPNPTPGCPKRYLLRRRRLPSGRSRQRIPVLGGVSLWALIHVLDICLNLEDAVAWIGVCAEEFRWALSLAERIKELHDLDHIQGVVAAVVHKADA